MKLVMTLRTRDQADVVGALLEFHFGVGVDYVIATDHRSEDGTVETLEEYARAGLLHLIREHGAEVRGSEWRTLMARMAATEFHADWTFSCDGDEFWWPHGATLKDVFAAVPDDRGIVLAPVRNFVPVVGAEEPFWERMTVRFAPEAALHDPLSPFRPYVSKVAHRADPTVVVHRGNHTLPRSQHLPVPRWFPIEVLHFPIRTVRQANAKYLVWAEALGDAAHLAAVRASDAGRGGAQGPGYFLDERAVERGLATGTLVEDLRLRDALRALSPLGAGKATAAAFSADRESHERDRASDFEAAALRLRRRADELARRTVALESR